MNWIASLHGFLVAYLIILPIIPQVGKDLLLLHVALLTSILFHWTLNNDICALTLLEQRLFPDTPKNELFMQRLVSPVYSVTNRDVHMGTYLLLLLTILKYYLTK
jgi:hypothetical protein